MTERLRGNRTPSGAGTGGTETASPATLPPAAQQIDAIQLLRAIAALAVVTQHIPFAIFGDGFWGVDLFFVISGFIMCHVTERSTAHFFTKRLIRIVPLYWAGTLGIWMLALTIPSLLNTSTADLGELLKSLFFVPFRKGELVVPLIFQGWTLNYEMLFYLLFALALHMSHRHRAMICAAVIFVIVVAGKAITIDSLVWNFFAQPILLEFVFGMVCYAIYARTARFRIESDAHRRMAWAFVGLLALASLPFAARFVPSDERVVKWGILSALAFSCIVHGLAGARLPRLALLVGDASYSLYLFHIYVIQLLNKVFRLGELDREGPAAYIWAAAVLAACVASAIALHVGFERPIGGYLRKKLLGRPLEQVAARSGGPAGVPKT